MRYFAKLGSSNKPINVYRFHPAENGMIEEFWSSEGWKKDWDAEIVGYLALGEGDFTEITEELARKTFPQAFNPKNAATETNLIQGKRFYDITDLSGADNAQFDKFAEEIWQNEKFYDSQQKKELNYTISIQGASVNVAAWGFENFFLTLHQLSKLETKQQLKCWTRFCKSCNLYKIPRDKSLLHHIIKISATQVKALLDIYGKSLIVCEWARPDSEWAINHGNALNHLHDLLNSGSKPVFYISLNSEAYYEFLLGSNSNPELDFKEEILLKYRNFCFGGTYDKKMFDDFLDLARNNVEKTGYPQFSSRTYEESVQIEHFLLLLKELRKDKSRVLRD